MHLLGQETLVPQEEANLPTWYPGGCARRDRPPRRHQRPRDDHRHPRLGRQEAARALQARKPAQEERCHCSRGHGFGRKTNIQVFFLIKTIILCLFH